MPILLDPNFAISLKEGHWSKGQIVHSINSYVKDLILENDENTMMLSKAYLLYNMVRAEDSSKVNGICRCITGRTLGCSKVFPKRSKYSRDKFLNSLGKNGSLFLLLTKTAGS